MGSHKRGPDVDNPVFRLDIRILWLSRHFLKHLLKQAIRMLHDVGLGQAGHLLAIVGTRIFHGVAANRLTSGTTDQLQGLDHFSGLLMLDPGIQVFLVFPHDDHVDIREIRGHVGRIGHTGAHV